MALAALIVAGLSFVWTIGWSIYTHRTTTRPHVKVSAALAFLPTITDRMFVTVTVTNVGQPAITLQAVYVAIKGREKTVALVRWDHLSEPFGTTYKNGGSWNGLIDVSDVAKPIATVVSPGTKIRFVARDAADNRFASSWRAWDKFLGTE